MGEAANQPPCASGVPDLVYMCTRDATAHVTVVPGVCALYAASRRRSWLRLLSDASALAHRALDMFRG